MIDDIYSFQRFTDAARIENISMNKLYVALPRAFAKKQIVVTSTQIVIHHNIINIRPLRKFEDQFCSNISGATGDEDVHGFRFNDVQE